MWPDEITGRFSAYNDNFAGGNCASDYPCDIFTYDTNYYGIEWLTLVKLCS